MRQSEQERPSYQLLQGFATVNEDHRVMSTSLYYTPSDMAAIAYTVPFLSQQSTSNDDGFSCREYSAPFLSSHSSYPSVPPYNGYILPHMPSSSPPSTSRNGLPVPNSMPRNPGTLSFHSHVQSVQCVDAPTLNARLSTHKIHEMSTGAHDSDPTGQIRQGSYRSTVSTLATQRAASHRRKHPPKYTCQHCSTCFTTARNQRNHENSHRNLKIFACSICHMAMATRSNVLRHGRKQHPGQGSC
ncbi:hypothetical protein H2248_008305 [Termitomyces sp. 'cryptogamus']|nr:hypothetical protein H2248_008305 [Termitomyces sp. 'cryptogamus']